MSNCQTRGFPPTIADLQTARMKNLGPLYVQEGFPMSSQSSLFDDLPRRRLWLLSKALEAVPLKEALQLAQAAQDFLDGASPSDVDLAISPRDPGRLALPHYDTAIPLASADRLDDAGAVTVIEPALLPSGAAFAETSDTQEAPRAPTGLVVLAGPDDVVRYLRRADDAIVPTQDGEYMVNGRFRESLEELVKRANRIRARHRQPLFQLMPMSFGRVAEDRVASTAAVSRGAEQVEQRDMIYGDEAVAAE
jgi:hypothetical protein